MEKNKVREIYARFPWLEKIYPERNADCASVKMMCEEALDIKTKTSKRDVGGYFPKYLTVFHTSAYLVDHRTGACTTVGKRVVGTVFMFFLILNDEWFDGYVRGAVVNLPDDSKATHLVVVQYANQGSDQSRITVFEPPKGMTIRQWYKTIDTT